MLKYAHENGCPWDIYACDHAAANGHLEVLKYLHENGCTWGPAACEAVIKGHFEILKYLHENGCRCDKYSYKN